MLTKDQPNSQIESFEMYKKYRCLYKPHIFYLILD